MATSFAVRTDVTEKLRKDYQRELDVLDLDGLVREFLSYLDIVEESDNWNEFHPITLGCCRALMIEPLGMCLEKMRQKTNV